MRVAPAGLAAIRLLADAETEGNVSEMIRILLAEAITARQSTTRTSSKARTRVPTA